MSQVLTIDSIEPSRDSQNATRNAYANVRNESGKKVVKAGKPPARRMESVASRLQDAAIELEFLLGDLSMDDQDEVHEALGRIMETQQLVAAAHARLRRQGAANRAR